METLGVNGSVQGRTNILIDPENKAIKGYLISCFHQNLRNRSLMLYKDTSTYMV